MSREDEVQKEESAEPPPSRNDEASSPRGPSVKSESQETSLRGMSPLNVPRRPVRTLSSRSPLKTSSRPDSPTLKQEGQREAVVGGDVTLKLEPGQTPKLARSSSKKVPSRAPPTFLDWPDAKSEASKTFEPMTACSYSNKFMGLTDHVLECDCSEEWDPGTKSNQACGEDSDCINRATKMECDRDCGCGDGCQNQRFQRKQWADVTVIKTPKKGFGLRANVTLEANQFIFEYIGEVIGANQFARRRQQYHDEGIKHFYFMSLTKDEFVDATRKGNLGRFCNHSCNPNCYVDKWVVGERLRMGIFAERRIAAGEELTFNYNVDRYGADPQPCYCEEINCTGFIGGKTQTERATKLSALTIEALGIEDDDDWDLAVARRPKKKKTEEDDEEYVDSVKPKTLDEAAVQKVMASLMQTKEKWLVVKLLNRLQTADDDRIRNRIVRMHGYRILKTTLSTWMEDVNVVLQVFDILYYLPRITRNKIQDSNIEETMQKLTLNEDERVKDRAEDLLKIWAALEVGYRIKKREPGAAGAPERLDREERRRERVNRERSRSRSKSPSKSPPRGPSAQNAPTGPRAGGPQRPQFRPPPRRQMNFLPDGWYSATNPEGKTYYYNANGTTTWERPVAPSAPPPPPPKDKSNQERLQEIIDSITGANTTKSVASSEAATPVAATPQTKSIAVDHKLDKWRELPTEKLMKLYENTLSPHIQHVMGKYKGKMERDDLKRFAKEIGKKLVQSDFKRNRVEDPTKISSKRANEVKKHVAEFFDKAVAKKAAHEKKKSSRSSGTHHRSSHHHTHRDRQKTTISSTTPPGSPPATLSADFLPPNHKLTPTPTAIVNDDQLEPPDDDEDGDEGDAMDISEEEFDASTPSMTAESELKRKREADETPLTGVSPGNDESVQKKLRSVEALTPPPPPPPPPPSDPPNSTESPFHENTLDTPSSVNTPTARLAEAGLGDQDDVRGSFTKEALVAVASAPGSFESKHPTGGTPNPPRQDLTSVMDAMRRSMRQ